MANRFRKSPEPLREDRLLLWTTAPPPEKEPVDPQEKSPEQLRKDRVWLWTWFPAILLLTSMIWVGPWIITIYDESHQKTIDCTVTDALAEKSSGSARGSSPHDRVIIQTADCGELLLQEGINQSNRDAVAAELMEGKRFSFEVGGASLKPRWAKLTPPVWAFQKIG